MSSGKKKKVLLVGGGSGGHIVPILNIYKKLKDNPNLSLLIVGGQTSIDKKMYAGVKSYRALITGKLNRAIGLNNLLQLFLLIIGIFQSLLILLRFKPNLIFSKAGYVSLPIIFWAKILKIPYMIHESDIVMGAANNFAAAGAVKVFVGFDPVNYPKELIAKIIFSGQILRPEILEKDNHSFDFGFQNNKPIIFVTGGSQGSQNINNAIFGSLSQLLSQYNVIHHVGIIDFAKAINIRAKLSENEKKSYFISELLANNPDGTDLFLSAVSSAQLIIGRASATSFAEFSAMRKPAIVVPYKYAAANHQSKNAAFYKKADAAIVISDDELNGETILEKINFLFKHSEKLSEISLNAYNLFPRDGLDRISEEILHFLGLPRK